MVYEVCQVVDVPVVGLGGISNWMDVIEFIMAGATAVQIGTANFLKPDIGLDIIDGVENYMKNQGIKDLNDLYSSQQLEVDTYDKDECILYKAGIKYVKPGSRNIK